MKTEFYNIRQHCSTDDKIYSLDYLKVIAIVLVVLHHSLSFYSRDNYLPTFLSNFITIVSCIHVPLFFMVSGFLIHKQNLKEFYKKKLLFILLPFLFFTFLKLIYTYAFDSEFAHSLDIGENLYFSLVVGELYWFTYALLLMYLISPLFWKDTTFSFRLLIISFSIILIINLFGLVPVIRQYNVFQIFNFIQYLPFFLFGMILRRIYMKYYFAIVNFRNLSMLILFYLTFFIIGIYSISAIYFPVEILFYSCGLFVPLLLFLLFMNCKRVVLPFNKIAPYTYQIFFLDSFFKVVSFKIFYYFNIHSIFIVFIIPIIVVFLSVAFCSIAKIIPFLHILVGIKKPIKCKGM